MRLFPLLLLAACGSPPEPPPTSTGLDKEVVSGLKQRIRDQADAYDATYNKALADLERAQSLEPNMPGLAASINKVTRALRR